MLRSGHLKKPAYEGKQEQEIILENAVDTRAVRNKRRTREIQRVTVWGLVTNLGLSAMKFVFGAIGNSQALVADAVHSLSDSVTDVAVIVGARFWSAPADIDHPHGHGRIETVITFLIGVVLAAVGAALVYRALATMAKPHLTSPGWIAFIVAC
ncbi:MAG: cation diffusion facilitator family transporter, partial [Candidatus Zixiibacteriota bacterium]